MKIFCTQLAEKQPLVLRHASIFQENTAWHLRDGRTICFWHDSWTDLGPLYQVYPRFSALSSRKNMSVSEAWDSNTSSWNLYPRRPL